MLKKAIKTCRLSSEAHFTTVLPFTFSYLNDYELIVYNDYKNGYYLNLWFKTNTMPFSLTHINLNSSLNVRCLCNQKQKNI